MLDRSEAVRLAILQAEIEFHEAQLEEIRSLMRQKNDEALRLIERKWAGEAPRDLVAEDAYLTLQELQSEAGSHVADRYLDECLYRISPLLNRRGYTPHNMMPVLSVEMREGMLPAELPEVVAVVSAWSEFVLRHRTDASNERYARLAESLLHAKVADDYVEFEVTDAHAYPLHYLRVWADGSAQRFMHYADSSGLDDEPRPLSEVMEATRSRTIYEEDKPF